MKNCQKNKFGLDTQKVFSICILNISLNPDIWVVFAKKSGRICTDFLSFRANICYLPSNHGLKPNFFPKACMKCFPFSLIYFQHGVQFKVFQVNIGAVRKFELFSKQDKLFSATEPSKGFGKTCSHLDSRLNFHT